MPIPHQPSDYFEFLKMCAQRDRFLAFREINSLVVNFLRGFSGEKRHYSGPVQAGEVP
jgi:hypothetical protein